jgi:hypothetical protein
MAATDAIARIYFFTIAYLLTTGSAKARGSRTLVIPVALTPSMLLNNRPIFQGNRSRKPIVARAAYPRYRVDFCASL